MPQYGHAIKITEVLAVGFENWPEPIKHEARAMMLYSLWLNGHPLPGTTAELDARLDTHQSKNTFDGTLAAIVKITA